MEKELLFYDQSDYEYLKKMFYSMNYKILSLSIFLDNLKDESNFLKYNKGFYVIDISVLTGYNPDAIQSIGEPIFRLLSNYINEYILTRYKSVS